MSIATPAWALLKLAPVATSPVQGYASTSKTQPASRPAVQVATNEPQTALANLAMPAACNAPDLPWSSAKVAPTPPIQPTPHLLSSTISTLAIVFALWSVHLGSIADRDTRTYARVARCSALAVSECRLIARKLITAH